MLPATERSNELGGGHDALVAMAWSSDVLKSPVLDDSGHFMPFFQYHYDEPLGRLLWGPY